MTREARKATAAPPPAKGRREDGAAAGKSPAAKKMSSPFLAPPMAPAKPRPVAPPPQPPPVKKEPTQPQAPSKTTAIYTAKPRPVTGGRPITGRHHAGAAAAATAAAAGAHAASGPPLGPGDEQGDEDKPEAQQQQQQAAPCDTPGGETIPGAPAGGAAGDSLPAEGAASADFGGVTHSDAASGQAGGSSPPVPADAGASMEQRAVGPARAAGHGPGAAAGGCDSQPPPGAAAGGGDGQPPPGAAAGGGDGQPPPGAAAGGGDGQPPPGAAAGGGDGQPPPGAAAGGGNGQLPLNAGTPTLASGSESPRPVPPSSPKPAPPPSPKPPPPPVGKAAPSRPHHGLSSPTASSRLSPLAASSPGNPESPPSRAGRSHAHGPASSQGAAGHHHSPLRQAHGPGQQTSPHKHQRSSTTGSDHEGQLSGTGRRGMLSNLGSDRGTAACGGGSPKAAVAVVAVKKPPPLALSHRAVHLYFLQELAKMEVPREEPAAAPAAAAEGAAATSADGATAQAAAAFPGPAPIDAAAQAAPSAPGGAQEAAVQGTAAAPGPAVPGSSDEAAAEAAASAVAAVPPAPAPPESASQQPRAPPSGGPAQGTEPAETDAQGMQPPSGDAAQQAASKQQQHHQKGTVKLGSLKTEEVVRRFIRPATQPADCSFAEAVESGALTVPGDWCTHDGRFVDDRMTSGQAGKPVFGRATFYVIHSWTYKFKDLVSLIEQHYRTLPADTGWLDVYYWLDIFATRQNYEGPFTKGPDSDLAGVIRTAGTVLFTIHPLLRPTTPAHLWCLYEAIEALRNPGVSVELLVDDSGDKSNDKAPAALSAPPRSFADAYLELIERFKRKVIAPLDIATAAAFNDDDKAFLLTAIAKDSTETETNTRLQELLLSRMLDALLRHALKGGDTEGVRVLVQAGAVLHGSTVHLTAVKFSGDETTQLLGQILLTNRTVTGVYVRRSGLKTTGARAIAAALEMHPALTAVDLAENVEVKDEGILAITRSLITRTGPDLVRRLALKKTGMTDRGAEALAGILSGVAVESVSDAASAAEGPAAASGEAPGAAGPGAGLKCCGITELDVSFNPGITATGLQALAKGIAASSLLKLDLSRLPAVGAMARVLGHAVGSCASLSTLMLLGCKLSGAQLMDLASGLCRSSALKHLDLQENLLDEDAGAPVASLLRGCKHLHCLRLDGNSQLGSKQAMSQVAAALPDAGQLRTLGLDSVDLVPEGAKALAGVLPKSGLQDLDLGDNYELGDKGAQMILLAVQGHRTLVKLNLSCCSLTAASAQALSALLGPVPAAGSGARAAAGARAASNLGRGGKTSALEELLVAGNHDLPDSVLEQVASWRARRWGQRKAQQQVATV